MTDEVIVRFKWTAEELRAGMRWHYRTHYPRIAHILFWFFTCAMVFAGAFVTIRFGTDAGGFSVLLWGLGIIFYVFILYPWILRLQFSKRPDRDSEFEWRISDAGIKCKTNHSNSEQRWAAFSKVVRTKGGFLFYPTSRIFQWLPRHGFTSDADFERVSQLAGKNSKRYKTAE